MYIQCVHSEQAGRAHTLGHMFWYKPAHPSMTEKKGRSRKGCLLAVTGRRVLAMIGTRCGSRKVKALSVTGRKGSGYYRKEGFWL